MCTGSVPSAGYTKAGKKPSNQTVQHLMDGQNQPREPSKTQQQAQK
jgi:hypothetical protein